MDLNRTQNGKNRKRKLFSTRNQLLQCGIFEKGQAIVEMVVAAPLVVAALLMWTDINQMTSTQHRLMIAVYDGVKLTSQFSDLYITDCLSTSELKKKVFDMCRAVLPSSDCAQHFNVRWHRDDENPSEQITPEARDQIFHDLDQLLTRKTLCQTMKDRAHTSMSYSALISDNQNSPSYTDRMIHYCKDGGGHLYEKCVGLPADTVIDEFVGIEVLYPKSYNLGRIFGVMNHRPKSVTLLRSFRTAPVGPSKQNDEGCVFGIRVGMSVRYFCGQ